MLDAPLRWRKPRMVFVNSMSDLFHEKLTDEQIAAVFGVMAACPQHTFQLLTKRPRRMLDWFGWISKAPVHGAPEVRACMTAANLQRGRTQATFALPPPSDRASYPPWPLPNVWLGVSVENQKAADERIPLLLKTPAAVRWVSCEPLLGTVDLERVSWPGRHRVDVLRGGTWEFQCRCGEDHGFVNHGDMATIDWTVVGAEAGPGARPMDENWVRSIREQCIAAGVSFFYKQRLDGGRKVSMPRLDGVQWAQFPEVTK
jgi:protein gp37